MRYFYESDFDDYITGDTGEKRTFNKRNCYMFSTDENKHSIVITDSNNHIPSIEELKTFIMGLSRFIDTYNQDSINDYNLAVDQRNKQKEEQERASMELLKTEKPRPGYVYFIADNMGNFKIGLSKDINSRFKTYTEMPYDPEMIHFINCSDMVKVEEYFHTKFADKRFKGEWFKLDNKDIKYIKSGRYSEEITRYII
jgi:predicted GIY-YIG superfamily endonuclease